MITDPLAVLVVLAAVVYVSILLDQRYRVFRALGSVLVAILIGMALSNAGLLPGVSPTGRSVAVGLVVVAGFQEGKLAHEHIYWDQASVLVQLGLLEEGGLPVAGRRSAEKLRDESIPFNELINR